jgi:hypothetical protein
MVATGLEVSGCHRRETRKQHSCLRSLPTRQPINQQTDCPHSQYTDQPTTDHPPTQPTPSNQPTTNQPADRLPTHPKHSNV